MQKRVESSERAAPSVVHLLHRARQCAEEIFSRSIGTSDITASQYAILSAVAAHDDGSQTVIVNATGIDRSTTADIVRRLVKRGWLQRRRTKDDARAYAVRMTGEGRKALKIGESAAWEVNDKVLAAIPKARRDQFLEALAKIC